MGFSMSWIGARGLEKGVMLEALGLQETDFEDEDMEARHGLAELPTGWLVVYSRDMNFASPKRIASVAHGGEAIGVMLEEHVMFSGARGYRKDGGAWAVIHDPNEGSLYHLSVEGPVPAELAAIRDKVIRDQDAAGGEDANVDYVFDVPVDLAAALTGFRHDQLECEGQPVRRVYVDLVAPPPVNIWKLLFGRR